MAHKYHLHLDELSQRKFGIMFLFIVIILLAIFAFVGMAL
jgi:hypothetical protein